MCDCQDLEVGNVSGASDSGVAFVQDSGTAAAAAETSEAGSNVCNQQSRATLEGIHAAAHAQAQKALLHQEQQEALRWQQNLLDRGRDLG